MSSVSRPVLSIFPAAPSGANMFSRYVAFHHLSGNRSVAYSKVQLFGNLQARAMDPFGASLIKVFQVMPALSFPIDLLLEHATLFGFYSSVMAPERKSAWRHSQLESQARLINKFVTGQTGRFLTKQHLHFCPLCVDGDEQMHGFAYWRLVHQVPGVGHCPVHNIPLSGTCARCGLPISSETHWHPPARECPYCADHVFRQTSKPTSPAYQRFVELCNDVIEGKTAILDASNRKILYSRFASSVGLPSIAEKEQKDFVKVVLSSWHMPDLEALETALSAKLNLRFIREAMTGQDHVINPVGHLSIIAALEVAKPPRRIKPRVAVTEVAHPFSERCVAVLKTYLINPESLYLFLKKAADAGGLPEQAGIMLLEGDRYDDIFGNFRICGARLGRFAKELDELDISTTWSFSDIRSAVQKEVRREYYRKEVLQALKKHKFSRRV